MTEDAGGYLGNSTCQSASFLNDDVLNQMLLWRNQLEHVVHVDNSIVCKRGFFMGNIFGYCVERKSIFELYIKHG
jgi:hypothetical protein